jgi:alpha-galactosidase
VRFYKEHRELLQVGRFVRLRSPFEGDGNTTAWMSVSDDRTRAVVGWYRTLSRPTPRPDRMPLRGLDPDREYRVSAWPVADDTIGRANAHVRRGDDLEATGLLFDVGRHEAAGLGDFWARLFVLEAV